ncbi:MAG: class I SAM-dependent methyltransferase [Flavobacteriaceae bacterium]|nr:class I SAM-dependent methyltransferase [Flavobacteriaceae bacterium]
MDYKNKEDGYFKNLRPEMLSLLPKNAKTVLDIGCADGSFALSVKNTCNAKVWGVEYMEDQAIIASKKIDKVLTGAIEDVLVNLPENHFDVIYLNDVLEHLIDPYSILKGLKSKLKDNGVIISSIPNIRYHKVLVSLIFNKDWDYKDHGILDRTHLRFFTKKSIKKMYNNAGYTIVSHHGINPSKSIKPWIYNILFLFTALDIRFLQYATIAKK